jgi:uncharacterized membrane protein
VFGSYLRNIIIHLITNIMEINWFIVSIVFLVAIILIFVLIKQDKKDEKKLEKDLNFFKKEEEAELNDDKNL